MDLFKFDESFIGGQTCICKFEYIKGSSITDCSNAGSYKSCKTLSGKEVSQVVAKEDTFKQVSKDIASPIAAPTKNLRAK